MPDVQQIRLDPDPLEPYALSQGFRVGDLVIVSGQAAIDEVILPPARPGVNNVRCDKRPPFRRAESAWEERQR